MNAKQIYEALLERFGSETILALNEQATDPWIEVAAAAVAEVARFLKEEESLQFDSLNNLCGVDYLETDAKLAKNFPYEPHVEVVYHLYSFPRRHRITLKVKLPRWKEDRPGQLPEVPSVSDVWRIADWHERETYDLMGIRFTGHPNLVRILCPDDWVGHPLRKDYEFPLEYHGIRGK